MKLREVASRIGLSVPKVLELQKKFRLDRAASYPAGYGVLLRKLLYLSTLGVPKPDLVELLKCEKKILELLRIDSFYHEPLWFEALCTMRSGPTRLLLSGYDLGHQPHAGTVQVELDFLERERELFAAAEMGDSVLLELERYTEILNRVKSRLKEKMPLHRAALNWTERSVFKRKKSL